MNVNRFIIVLLCLLFAGSMNMGYAKASLSPSTYMYAEIAVDRNRLSQSWLDAIKTRLDRKTIDSLASIVRPLNNEEMKWASLIQSKLIVWNRFKDSLTVPFDGIKVSDTIRILL